MRMTKFSPDFAKMNFGKLWRERACIAALAGLGVLHVVGCGEARDLGQEGSELESTPAPSGEGQLALSADFDYREQGLELMERLVAESEDGQSMGERGMSPSFLLPRHDMPVPYQYNAGSCLYMTATGIVEWLMNHKQGITHAPIEGDTDLSERYTLTLGNYYNVGNVFTNVVDLYRMRNGYVLANKLPFTARMKGTEVDTKVNWNPVSESGLSVKAGIPRYTKRIIFNSYGNQYALGVMKQKDIEAIKTALSTYGGPVLFIYYPTEAGWWHANMLVGYDDQKQVFYARDSIFGDDRTDLAKYGYGTSTAADDHFYSGLVELPYSAVLKWGNHATSYAPHSSSANDG